MRGGRRTWRYGYPPMLYPTHSTGYHVGVTRERLTRVSCLGWGDNEPALRDNAYNCPHASQSALFSSRCVITSTIVMGLMILPLEEA